MKALVYGVEPEPRETPRTDNQLLLGLACAPVRFLEVDRPRLLGPDWVIARTRLTGICGSDAKQVFMDFGNVEGTTLGSWFSMPQILGHEVVAEVAELGPEARGLAVGQRVVLNPWLSCAPRGISPLCPSCRAGDLSLCEHFAEGRVAPGIHTGTSRDASGGWAEYLPAHDSMLIPVPDEVPDEVAVLADPFAVSLHSVTRNPPPPHGKVLIYGHGALGSCVNAIVHALHPDADVAVVARFPAQVALASRLGASLVVDPGDRLAVVEQVTRWAGGRIVPSQFGLPMAHPGGVDVVYDTIGKAETLEVGARVLKARGTLVQSGVHGPERWESSPLYFKELRLTGSNAFGVEEVEGVRKHGIEHYLDLVRARRVDLAGMLTHRFALDRWHDAFVALATQAESGAIKVAFDFR
ncbi:MAG: alcohol dehydrogenase catalytic domain-containing protein [Thermodesulfobacteriota bacterium]